MPGTGIPDGPTGENNTDLDNEMTSYYITFDLLLLFLGSPWNLKFFKAKLIWLWKQFNSKNCLVLFLAYASFSLYSEEICRLELSLMINFWQLWQIIYALEKNWIPCLLFGENDVIKWIPLIYIIWTKYLWIELLGEKKFLNHFHKTLSWTFLGELMLRGFFDKQNQKNFICVWQNKTHYN